MSLEEEHEALHRRGEMVKFMLLVLALVSTVLLIALMRPLIFERVVPAVLGLDRQPGSMPSSATPMPGESPGGAPGVAPATVEGELPRIMTATPAAEGTPGASAAGANGGAPLPTPQVYEVQRGDTMVEIAERFGVSLQALVQANGIANPNRIQPGDVLTIPAP